MMIRPSALVASLLITLAACGGDKKPAADATPAAAVAPAVITITTKDFAYEMPDTIAGGVVTLKLSNQGQNLHHVQFLKIDEGHTFAELAEGLKHMKPTDAPPPWVHDVAGPNSPVPGGESLLTTTLGAGNYAVVCFVDTPDKVPHFAKGMVHALTVVAPTGVGAALPAADITVTMKDYAWDLSAPLTAGKHTLKLLNVAEQSHELLLARLDSGKTADDLTKWAQTYHGKPPATPLGGISGMAKGGEAYLSVDLTPGNYVFICFLPDAKDHQPHVAHGMIKSFTIT